MPKGRLKKSALLAATALAAGASASPIRAQEPGRDGGEVETVVVTGTRLQNQGFVSPTPLTVIGSEAIQQRAPSSILDVMNEIPSFRLSTGASQGQRLAAVGASQSLLDLRGLGPSRTLVLVDGRRFVPSNTAGSVDSSLIPVGLIDRVDVVTGGASAAYGSDAVAGVTNFILKDRFEGFNATLVGGRSYRGDNVEYGVSMTAGRSFLDGRMHVIAGGEFNRNDGVGNIYTRDWSSIEAGNSSTPIQFGASRPAGMPAQGFLTGVQYSAQTKGSVINSARTATGAVSTALNQTAFNPDGTSYTLVRGSVYGNLMTGGNNFGAGPIAAWSLRLPTRRAIAMARLNFDVTDDVTAFAEFNYGEAALRAATSYHQTPSAIILRDNPYLPEDIRARMAALNLTQIDIGRVDTDWPGTTLRGEWRSSRFAAGLRGKVLSDWDWDVYVQHGRTKMEGRNSGSKESNIQAAIYAVRNPVTGAIECGDLATNPNFAASRQTAIINPSLVQAGCKPFNPFGIGRNNQETIAYLSGVQVTETDIKQTVVAANLAGSIFKLPAGDVSVAAGAEYRKDSLDVTADPLQILGIYSFGNNKPYDGENTVKEAYAEIGVPVLRDLPGFVSLDLNAAVRRTDYKTSGAVTTWKVGGTWDITEAVRLRATRSRDIRAPNLAELFNVGGVSVANNVFNPFNSQSARLPTSTSGNPNLTPEIADTVTAGIVFQPRSEWLSGLRMSLDYYDIQVRDVIATVSGPDILNRCFEGVDRYCSAIDFDSSVFGIRLIRVGPFNQAELETRGFDFEASYRLPSPVLGGRIDTRLLVSRVLKLERTDRAGAAAVKVDYAGSVNPSGGVPEWSGTFIATYTGDHLVLGLQARTFSTFKYDPRLKGPNEEGYNPAAANSININRFPALVYLNANAAYNFQIAGHDAQVFGLVNNLTDQDPPALAIAAVNSGGNPYDYVGRTFKVGLRLSW